MAAAALKDGVTDTFPLKPAPQTSEGLAQTESRTNANREGTRPSTIRALRDRAEPKPDAS
jgi:hypothetical protein